MIYISKKEKPGLSSGNAGLVRYFDDYKEAVQIKPEHVLGFISVIIVLELVLKYMA